MKEVVSLPGSARKLEAHRLLPRVHQERAIRVLLIHQAFCGPNDPGGTRHYEFARRMVARGHSFAVVTSNVSYLTGERVGQKGFLAHESLDGIDIFRARAYELHRSSFFLRVASMFSFAMTSLVAACRAGSADVIVGTTPPIFQAASACVVALCRRRPFVLEVRDLWPAFAIDMGILKNPVLIKISRWLEHTLYRRAAHVIVNSPAYRDYLLGLGVASDKIEIIANGVDAKMFDPGSRGEQVRERFRLQGKFVVTYAGALGIANDIGTILRAAARLREQGPQIHFLLVGDGKERVRLQEKALAVGLNNVTFAGAQPKEHMAEFLAASDVCVATLQDIPMFRTTYPNKVFDYMAAGKPTILAIDGVIRHVIERAQAGICIAPGNDMELAEAVLRLSRDNELRGLMGARARVYVTREFNREEQAQAFVELLVRIAQSGSGQLRKMRQDETESC